MLEIVEAALFTTVQDAGRRGWQAFGIPVSGPMDAFALRAANLLVDNPPAAAALEVGITSAEFYCHAESLVAVCGAGFRLFVDNRSLPLWMSVYVRARSFLRIEKAGDGNWAVLAIHGGIQTQPVLGSRATTLRTTLGTEPARSLAPGNLLAIGPVRAFLPGLAARKLSHPPTYKPNPTIRFLPGPQRDWFTPEALKTFSASVYSLSPTSDRTGYRLSGPTLARTRSGEMVSEGMARGCIQVPADGQPIAMQADCPSMGGYPKIASVISADQPLLAQTPFASGQIRFIETDIETAQSSYRQIIREMDNQIRQASDGNDYLWAGF